MAGYLKSQETNTLSRARLDVCLHSYAAPAASIPRVYPACSIGGTTDLATEHADWHGSTVYKATTASNSAFELSWSDKYPLIPCRFAVGLSTSRLFVICGSSGK